VDSGAEHQPTGVHEQVALPAGEALGSIVSALRASDPGALDCLAVDHGCGRLPLASVRLAHRRTQSVVSLLESPVEAPLAEVVVDRLPRWVFPWQHPPGAAGA
jgi:hypothetical protein